MAKPCNNIYDLPSSIKLSREYLINYIKNYYGLIVLLTILYLILYVLNKQSNSVYDNTTNIK